MDTEEPELWTPEKESLKRSRKIVMNFLGSKSAAWFLLGMATEAFDVAISSMMNWPYHPGIDFVIWAFIGMALLYWQKKHPEEMELVEDGPVESED